MVVSLLPPLQRMALSLLLALLAPCVHAVSIASDTAEALGRGGGGTLPALLAADDECAAEGSGGGDCGLQALQRRGQLQEGEGEHLQVDEAKEQGRPGTVSAVYTFGAPATSSTPFTDLNRPDGIFQGLRCYTENIFGVAGESKQIDGGAIFGDYKHPKLATAVLHWKRDSYFVPGAGKPEWPQSGAAVYADWGLHKERHYVDRLRHITVGGRNSAHSQPFAKALQFSYVAFKAYSNRDAMKHTLQTHLHGWKLVAHEAQNTLEAVDAVWLAQDKATLGCLLSFTGTSRASELSTSVTQYSTGYCGYTGVHVGYRNKLYWLTKGMWPKLRPKLAQCSSVTCTGHSLGGALCDIFAACANSKRTSDVDYRRQMWVQGAPQSIPEI